MSDLSKIGFQAQSEDGEVHVPKYYVFQRVYFLHEREPVSDRISGIEIYSVGGTIECTYRLYATKGAYDGTCFYVDPNELMTKVLDNVTMRDEL